VLKTIDAIYARARIEIRQKARNLFILLLALLLFVPVVIVFDIVEADYSSIAVEGPAWILFLCSLVIFRRGRYEAASLITIALATALFVALLAVSNVLSAQRMYSAALYMAGLLLLNLFITPRAAFSAAQAAFGLATLVVLYVLLLPAVPAAAKSELESSFIPVIIIHTGLSLIAVTISRSYERMLRQLQEEIDRSQSQLEKVRAAEAEVHRLNADLERRVAERTARLEEAVRDQEAFSYSVSHDLRAPLRTLDGFSRILLNEHGAALPPAVVRSLSIIHESGRQMGRMIDDLLNFSRLGRQALRKQPVDPAAMAREALAALAEECAGRRVEVTIGDLPGGEADPALFRQVWINLLSNAIKYTRHRETARIDIGCEARDGRPVYFVRDNGTGFDMQYSGKLFGVFQRLHRAEEYEGTGVGLAIVERIIVRHGGRVWAEAAEDRGATFFFTLGERGGPSGSGGPSRPAAI
jgi:signal transduction histidine kinase